MSKSSSNLSDARYGYDLVCATTQDSINATLKQHLAAAPAGEFSACYVFDPATKTKVLKPLADIAAGIGGDPFAIADGAGGTDPMVQKLHAAGFLFGFKARIGLPEGVAPPDIIRLDKGSSRASYQLYFAELSAIVLSQNGENVSLAHLRQSAASPWLFGFEVGLRLTAGDQNAFNALPPPVQQRIRGIAPGAGYLVLQLAVDANAASLVQTPSINGLDPNSDAFVSLTRSFISQYWSTFGPRGVVLGTVILPSRAANPSGFVPTNLNFEVSPQLDGHGNPTTDFGLYTIDYLMVSKSRPMPPPTRFSWNWIEAAQQADYDGVMAMRRDVIVDGVLERLNQNAAGLCIDTTVELHHRGESYSIYYSSPPAPKPAAFAKVAPVDAGGGYMKVATFAYSHDSYDDSMAASHLSSINGTFNYAITGDVAIGNGNSIRVTLHAVVYAEFNARQAGVRHTIVSGNALDLTHVTTCQVAVTPNGRFTVTQTDNDSGGIGNLDYGTSPVVPNPNMIIDAVTTCANMTTTRMRGAAGNLGNVLASLIDSAPAWVCPAGKILAFKAAGFSSGLDLVAYGRLTAAS